MSPEDKAKLKAYADRVRAEKKAVEASQAKEQPSVDEEQEAQEPKPAPKPRQSQLDKVLAGRIKQIDGFIGEGPPADDTSERLFKIRNAAKAVAETRAKAGPDAKEADEATKAWLALEEEEFEAAKEALATEEAIAKAQAYTSANDSSEQEQRRVDKSFVEKTLDEAFPPQSSTDPVDGPQPVAAWQSDIGPEGGSAAANAAKETAAEVERRRVAELTENSGQPRYREIEEIISGNKPVEHPETISAPVEFDHPEDLSLEDLLRGPLNAIEDPELQKRIVAIRGLPGLSGQIETRVDEQGNPVDEDGNPMPIPHRTPYEIDGPTPLRDLVFDPLQLSKGDLAVNPSQVVDDLTDMYYMREWRIRGYTDSGDIPQEERKSMRSTAERLAYNKVSSIMGNAGDNNLLVMRDVEEAVKRGGALGAFLGPFSMTAFPGTYTTVRDSQVSGEWTGVPVFHHRDSLTNSQRLSPVTAIAAWWFGPDMNFEIGGKYGYGGENHLRMLAYGWDPFQAWDDVVLSAQILTGVADEDDVLYDDSPATQFASSMATRNPVTPLIGKALGPEEDAWWIRKEGIPGAIALASYIPYIVFDPNIWNVAMAGVGQGVKASRGAATMLERAMATRSLSNVDEALRILAAADDIDDPEAIATAVQEALGPTHLNPESMAARDLEQARAIARMFAAQDVLIDRSTGLADIPITNVSLESAAAGKDFHDVLPGWISRFTGPKHSQAARSRAAILDSVSAERARAEVMAQRYHLDHPKGATINPASQAQARLQILRAEIVRVGADHPQMVEYLDQIDEAFRRRASVIQAIADDAMLSEARMPGSLFDRARRAEPNRILRELYRNKRALMNAASDAANKYRTINAEIKALGASPNQKELRRLQAAQRSVVRTYKKVLANMGRVTIVNIGDMGLAASVARLRVLDNVINDSVKAMSGIASAAGDDALAANVKKYRALYASDQDSLVQQSGTKRVAIALSANRSKATLREALLLMKGGLESKLAGGAQRPAFSQVFPQFIAGDKFNFDGYVDALRARYGNKALVATADSPNGMVLAELSRAGTEELTPVLVERLRLLEETMDSTAWTMGGAKENAVADAILTSVRQWRNWPVKDGFTPVAYNLLQRMRRKLDIVGGTDLGTASKQALEVARHVKMQFRDSIRDVDGIVSGRIVSRDPAIKMEGLDAVFDFMSTRHRYGDLLWNQGHMVPAEKSFHYLRSLAFADQLSSSLTGDALAGLPLGSFDAGTPRATAHSRAVIERLLKSSAGHEEFWGKALDEVNKVYLSELGGTGSEQVSKLFLLKAMMFGSSQYDGWIDMQRLFGANMTADAANALNYFQRPGASMLPLADPVEGLVMANQWGLPLHSQVRGRMELGTINPFSLFMKATRQSSEVLVRGLDRGFGVILPKVYIDAVENSSEFDRVAKELVEFSDKNRKLIGSRLMGLWTAYRLGKIYGFVLNKFSIIPGNVIGGGWSQPLLEAGGLGRATSTLALTAPTIIPRIKMFGRELVSGFTIQKAIASGDGAISRLFDENVLRFIAAEDNVVLTLPNGDLTTVGRVRQVMAQEGILTNLATDELDEVARKRAATTAKTTPKAPAAAPDDVATTVSPDAPTAILPDAAPDPLAEGPTLVPNPADADSPTVVAPAPVRPGRRREFGTVPPPKEPVPPLPKAPEPPPQGRSAKVWATAKRLAEQFIDNPTPRTIERFANWVEDIDSAQRSAFFLQLHLAEGVTEQEAANRTLSRFMDFAGGITPQEAPFFGRLMMVYRFKRLWWRQLAENMALSLAEASVRPWWQVATGETAVGRMGRLYRAKQAAVNMLDWRDDDEPLDDSNSNHEILAAGARALPWYVKAQFHMAGWEMDDKKHEHESEIAGRVVTDQELMFVTLTALDQLDMMNAFAQALIASSVGVANSVVDTNLQPVGSAGSGLGTELTKRTVEGFGDSVDPLIGELIRSITRDYPKAGVKVPRGDAIAIKRMMQFFNWDRFGYVTEDPDGSLRIDPNFMPLVTFMATKGLPLLGDDVGRFANAIDTPELASGEYGNALLRTLGALSGLMVTAGFDPATEHDYDVHGRAAELRDAVRRADQTPKNERQ